VGGTGAWIRGLCVGGALLAARPAWSEVAPRRVPAETDIVELERQVRGSLSVLGGPDAGGESPGALAPRVAPKSHRSWLARGAGLLFTAIAAFGWASLAFIAVRWTYRRLRAFALRRTCRPCGERMHRSEEVIIRPTRQARGHGVRLYACPSCGAVSSVPFELPALRAGRDEPVDAAEVIVGAFNRARGPDGHGWGW
jgi:hypothetical protein